MSRASVARVNVHIYTRGELRLVHSTRRLGTRANPAPLAAAKVREEEAISSRTRENRSPAHSVLEFAPSQRSHGAQDGHRRRKVEFATTKNRCDVELKILWILSVIKKKQYKKMGGTRVFLIFFVLGFAADVRSKVHHKRDSAYLSHVQLVHQFRCSLPQPRAVPVEELLTVGPSPDEIFYPPSTVLARCEGSGCCPVPGNICGPIETRNISLVFTVKHRIDSQRDRHHEVIHAIEHTKCGCGAADDERFIRAGSIA